MPTAPKPLPPRPDGIRAVGIVVEQECQAFAAPVVPAEKGVKADREILGQIDPCIGHHPADLVGGLLRQPKCAKPGSNAALPFKVRKVCAASEYSSPPVPT